MDYTPTEQDKDTMYNNLKLLDPSGDGVTLDKFRIFYPRLGWSKILLTLRALEAEGRIDISLRGQPQFEHYVWIEESE